MDKTLSTIAMITGVIGALLIALNINMFILGYSLFLSSSILWIIYSVRTRQMNLFLMNFVFTIINLIGLINFI